MRKAGLILAGVFEEVGRLIRPGVSGVELDRAAERAILRAGAGPAFKGYRGFPASVCLSVNEVVVHGIPGPARLKAGDIAGIDIGVEYQGFFADSAHTYAVDEIGPEVRRLLVATERALWAGIEQCRPGRRLGDVSHAIQQVAEGAGYSVVRELVGHGIGREMHEKPEIPNFGRPGHGVILQEGMVLALEPMVNMGSPIVGVAEDQWTVYTADRKPSAHFEHTVAVTAKGPWVLTDPEDREA